MGHRRRRRRRRRSSWSGVKRQSHAIASCNVCDDRVTSRVLASANPAQRPRRDLSSRSHAVLHKCYIPQSPRTRIRNRTTNNGNIFDYRSGPTSNMGNGWVVTRWEYQQVSSGFRKTLSTRCGENGDTTRTCKLYRNSKLTRSYSSSRLGGGGSCETVYDRLHRAYLHNHFDDTHNTLLYTEHPTKIKTKVVTPQCLSNIDRQRWRLSVGLISRFC